MAGEIKAHGAEFLAQPLMHRPVRHGGQAQFLRRASPPPNRRDLPAFALARAACAPPRMRSEFSTSWRRLGLRLSKAPARTRFSKARLLTSLGSTRRAKSDNGFERAAFAADLHHMIHRLAAHALHRRQRVEHHARLGIAGEHRFGAIDVGRRDLARPAAALPGGRC